MRFGCGATVKGRAGTGVVCVCMGLLVLLASGCSTPAGSVPAAVPYAGPTPTSVGISPSTPVLSASGEPLAARVNGIAVYLRDYQQQVTEWEIAFITQNNDLNEEEKQAMLAQGRRQVLDVMIEQALIEQAAAREGINVSDQEVETVITRDIEENGGQAKFDAWLEANNWTYDEYRSRQRSMMIASTMFERVTGSVPKQAEQVHARHILVADESEARDLLAQLQAGADFGQLAQEHSLDPSTKESGGDLGFFPRDTLVVPEMEDVAFSLSVGQISDLLQSPMGYHIIQVMERVQDKPLTEESWQALKEATFRRWVSELWDAADVEILIQL
jgi:parvulin-like peptidyl-prolyl isomerase